MFIEDKTKEKIDQLLQLVKKADGDSYEAIRLANDIEEELKQTKPARPKLEILGGGTVVGPEGNPYGKIEFGDMTQRYGFHNPMTSAWSGYNFSDPHEAAFALYECYQAELKAQLDKV